MSGALHGIRIVEFTGLGPGPFAGMMLADHGADVIRIDKIGSPVLPDGACSRSRRSLALDLKKPEAIAIARKLCQTADAIIEGYRPGVMERMGLGPDVLLADNPRLVYGRMTGWGQYGPLAQRPGHDINYIAIAGALHGIGRKGQRPVPPVNYLADFGGGGMLLSFGMVAALLAVKNGAPGQVVDAAMTDGTALLTAMTWGLYNGGMWEDRTGANHLDGAAHYYDTYETADGKFISVGSIEKQFYARLLNALGLSDDPDFTLQMDRDSWPRLKARMQAIFLTRSRDEWTALLEGEDLCFAPVLSLEEAKSHPHNVARGTFGMIDGDVQPMPAPRFSATPPQEPVPAVTPGDNNAEILAELGFSTGEIDALHAKGVTGVPTNEKYTLFK